MNSFLNLPFVGVEGRYLQTISYVRGALFRRHVTSKKKISHIQLGHLQKNDSYDKKVDTKKREGVSLKIYIPDHPLFPGAQTRNQNFP